MQSVWGRCHLVPPLYFSCCPNTGCVGSSYYDAPEGCTYRFGLDGDKRLAPEISIFLRKTLVALTNNRWIAQDVKINPWVSSVRRRKREDQRAYGFLQRCRMTKREAVVAGYKLNGNHGSHYRWLWMQGGWISTQNRLFNGRCRNCKNSYYLSDRLRVILDLDLDNQSIHKKHKQLIQNYLGLYVFVKVPDGS